MIGILTENEHKFLNLLATGRHFIKDIVIPDRKLERWNNTQNEADILGVIGEYVVAKYLEIPFDTTVNLEGDGGEVDMYLGEWTIQVKASKYENARLVFNSIDEMKSSFIYLLVIIENDEKTYRIAGYITRNKIKRVHYKEDLGHGIRFCVDQNQLEPIEELLFNFLKHKKH